ncbi:MAG: hypothetical protein M0Z77_08665 [Thermoplasmatales archaeon]|jgi:VIT1/CCC1 family predicted Fe2+/Mn2+ transporter|nr:hypothetical protein [Candidatus Thermoplasmatota archaeon]MDA8055698.1 hypothetical protein [Thermoplasmatales archaeon]
MFRREQTPVSSFLLKLVEKKYGIDQTHDIQRVSSEVSSKRNEIYNHMSSHQALKEELTLYEKFLEYDKMLEELILIKRVESGVSTLFFFLYSILAGIVGAIMEILVFLTTTGLVGHLILSLSIAGSVVGVTFALYSMKRERMFVFALKSGFDSDFQYSKKGR